MTIIIETPQPPIRERLVLVREAEPMAPRRDATPEDLERAGWVRVETAARLRSDLVEMQREDEEARSVLGVEYPAEPTTTAARRVARERDEAREALATWRGSAEQERARCVAYLRAEAERARHMLPESGRNEPWPHAEAVGAHLDIAADRLERGEHAGTPVPERATDEELFAAYQAAFVVACGVEEPSDSQRSVTRVMPAERKGILAVAARVRRERCLVTRAVEAGGIYIERTGHHGGKYWVEVGHGMHAPARNLVDAADVPATVERLLGEVTR